MTSRRWVALGVAIAAVVGAFAVYTTVAAKDAAEPLRTPAPVPILLTNEYAYEHGGAPDAVRSPEWIATSGSLFGLGDQLWSGRPDDQAPGPTSASGTDSAVLRFVSTRRDYANVKVSFALRVMQLTETARTPAQDHDGVHIFLRYQSEFSTYYVSVFRRDGQVIIKKKVAGGPSNGGTYFTLAAAVLNLDANLPGTWHHVESTAAPGDRGGVALTLRIDGHLAIDVTDRGAQAPVIAVAGRVGMRGDNCEFYVRDFRADPLVGP